MPSKIYFLKRKNMKKGFTLVETVVALAVILVISAAFFSMATFASVNLEKSNIKNYGIMEMDGITSVFEATSFESAGQFSALEFQQNLAFCGYELRQENQSFTFSKQVDGQGQVNHEGKGKYQFFADFSENFITLSGQILYGDKVLYEMPAFQKAVGV